MFIKKISFSGLLFPEIRTKNQSRLSLVDSWLVFYSQKISQGDWYASQHKITKGKKFQNDGGIHIDDIN